MTINKQLISTFLTTLLLVSCASTQDGENIESLISPSSDSSESEVATTTEPQETDTPRQRTMRWLLRR